MLKRRALAPQAVHRAQGRNLSLEVIGSAGLGWACDLRRSSSALVRKRLLAVRPAFPDKAWYADRRLGVAHGMTLEEMAT